MKLAVDGKRTWKMWLVSGKGEEHVFHMAELLVTDLVDLKSFRMKKMMLKVM